MPYYPTNVDVTQLDGETGFRLVGGTAATWFGASIAAVGDINGDGIDDFIVSAPNTDYYTGAQFVVFGGQGGFPASFDVNLLDGANGFKIVGGGQYSFGWAVSGVGDLNGDGIADLAIGHDSGNGGTGAVYVVFGRSSFDAVLDVDQLASGEGLIVNGLAAGDSLGQSIAPAGDFNGDGFDDLLIGATAAFGDTLRAGVVYVVFGSEAGLPDTLSVADLNGANGLRLTGDQSYEFAGRAVSSAGDVNGDGVDDILIGAPGHDLPGSEAAGVAYVVFGSRDPLPASIDLAQLDGTNGFRMYAGSNMSLGWSVSSAGDFNGDGIGDVLIGLKGASAYVLFGRADGFAADIDLRTLDGTDGFSLSDAFGTSFGDKVAGGGDFNGDGFDDILVAAPVDGTSGLYGAIYLVFGNASGFGPVVDVTTLTPGVETRIGGAYGLGYSVAFAGDINGDGLDDIAVGSIGIDNGAFVVFGRQTSVRVTGGAGADNYSGGSMDDTLRGWGGDDTLSGLGGADVLIGDDGADNLDGGEGNDSLNGGTGADVMTGGNGDDTFFVDDAGDSTIELAGGGSDTVHASISWTLGANIEKLILDGAGDIDGTGNSLANVITGNGGANRLDGGDGADLIKAGAGADTVLGGGGNDQLLGEDGADSLDGGDGNDRLDGGDGNDILAGGLGTDILEGGLGADSLDGGAGADQLRGGDGDDSLVGGDGDDMLNGGLGADAMAGGLGDDIYYVDDAGDTTAELPGQGTDVVRATISWTLADQIENLILDGAGDLDGTGNALANTLNGNSGANRLDGGDGNDVLKGGDGNDVLIGGRGADILVGGAGADVFVVTQDSMRTTGVIETDTINDLIRGEGDRLDLSAIDADSLTDGDQAFHLVGAFTHHAAEMTLTFSAGKTTLLLDVNGDGSADYRMTITGNVTGDSGSWLL